MILSAIAVTLLSWLQIPGGTWEVDEGTVAEVKSYVESAVADAARSSPGPVPAWSSYTLQFQGRTVNGKKMIFVNGFCSVPPETAAIEWVQTFDGGECSFNTYYDPETKQVLSIQFNGVA
jgi:hypothetical protein